MSKAKTDPIVTEDDDFEFGNESSAGADDKGSGEEGKEEGGDAGDKDDDKGSEDDKGTDDEKEKEDASEQDDDDVDKENEGKEKNADTKKKTEKSTEASDDDDPFAGEDDDNTAVLDIKLIAKEFDVEADDLPTIKAKINEKIESAKQEFKLDALSPDAQKLVKHLNENGGKLDDFFNNKEIASYQSILALDSEEKVTHIKALEIMESDKLSYDDARTKADEDIKKLSTRQIKDMSDNIDENVNKLISKEVDKIVGGREELTSAQRKQMEQKAAKETENIIKYVEKQEDFFGLKLTAKAKSLMIQDIKTGKFDEFANTDPVKAKFSAYMLNKYGKVIDEKLKTKASESSREGFNKATDKHLSALHKTKESAKGGQQGRDNRKQGDARNFDDWKSEFADE